MVRETLNYNIHGILSFQINRKKCKDFVKDINLPYSYFETEHIEKPDIVLNIGPFKPKNKRCCIVDHKWYIKNDYICCSEHIGNVKFVTEINGLETTPTIINVNSNLRKIRQLFLPSVLPQQIFLKQLINFKLLCKGTIAIHAAAISKDGKAIVFPGRGGTFKTTLSMDFVRKHDYKIFGDDWIIIDKNNVFSFLIHKKLFDYRVNKMKYEEYFILDKLKYVFYQKFKPYNPQYIADKANIAAVYFIVKSNGKDIKAVKLTKHDAIAKAVNSHKIECMSAPAFTGLSRGIYDYFTAYSYVFPDSKIANYWATYESTLNAYLTADEYYELSLPYKYTKTTFEYFINTVKALER